MAMRNLKDQFYEWSTGDYTAKERPVWFANRISNEEFEMQKKDYT